MANANSTPGFLRKLGFTLVGPLDAKVGVGALLPEPALSVLGTQFRRDWDRASLQWRCANPHRGYRLARSRAGGVLAHAPTGKPLLSAFAALPKAVEGLEYGSPGMGMRLHLGMVPRSMGALNGAWFELPGAQQPLNLIFRTLDGPMQVPATDAVLFSVLDFDAF